MEFQYQVGEEVKRVRVERDGGFYRVVIDERVYAVQVSRSRSDEVTFVVDSAQHTAYVAENGSTRYVSVGGDVFELKQPDPRRTRKKHHPGEDNLSASMPGQVTKVLVKDGDAVQRGQPLIVLEAMKMEIKIAAPHDGRVAKVLVKEGQVVERDQSLVEISQSG